MTAVTPTTPAHPAGDPSPDAGDARDAGPAVVRPGSPAYRLTLALSAVTVAAGVPTVAVHGVLHGPAAMAGSVRGTAGVMVAVAVPLALVAARATARGHVAAAPVWLGGVGYLLYNAVMLLFGTPFNPLFPLYVAVLALGFWTAATLWHDLDVARVAAAYPRGTGRRERVVAGYAWVVLALNALAWLRGMVPGLTTSAHPAFLDGTDLATSPTYVQDLGFWIPLGAVAAWWAWQGRPAGRPALGALLVLWSVEGLGVAVDQTVGHLADPSSPAIAVATVPAFVALAVVGLVPTVALLRRR